MFPALKASFLSQEKLIENDFNDNYHWHMHSIVCVPLTHSRNGKGQQFLSVGEQTLTVYTLLADHKKNNFISLNVKGLLPQKCTDWLSKFCDHFCDDVQGQYSACLEDLEKWMIPMEEFSLFMWMNLSEPLDLNDVDDCIKHLGKKEVPTDDTKWSGH